MFRFIIPGIVAIGILAPPTVGSQNRVAEPLVIDVNGDGLSLSSSADGVQFDLDGSQVTRQTAWTRAGSDDAFLAIDENRDGRITSGRELIAGLTGPPNAFSYLAALDGFATPADLESARNRVPDGKIDVHDAIFKRLVLWTDRNHNGISEEDELESLEYAGFETVYLGYEGVSTWDPFGNMIRYRGRVAKRNSGGVPVLREASTVRFAR
jgi:hypothetical protein